MITVTPEKVKTIQALNYCIQYAAKTGETSCIFQTPLDEDIQEELLSNEYIITPQGVGTAIKIDFTYINRDIESCLSYHRFNDDNTIDLILCFNAIEGLTMTEVGIVGTDVQEHASELSLDYYGAKRNNTNIIANPQLLNCQVRTKQSEYYIKSYVIYTDKDGNEQVKYGNLYTITPSTSFSIGQIYNVKRSEVMPVIEFDLEIKYNFCQTILIYVSDIVLSNYPDTHIYATFGKERNTTSSSNTGIEINTKVTDLYEFEIGDKTYRKIWFNGLIPYVNSMSALQTLVYENHVAFSYSDNVSTVEFDIRTHQPFLNLDDKSVNILLTYVEEQALRWSIQTCKNHMGQVAEGILEEDVLVQQNNRKQVTCGGYSYVESDGYDCNYCGGGIAENVTQENLEEHYDNYHKDVEIIDNPYSSGTIETKEHIDKTMYVHTTPYTLYSSNREYRYTLIRYNLYVVVHDIFCSVCEWDGLIPNYNYMLDENYYDIDDFLNEIVICSTQQIDEGSSFSMSVGVDNRLFRFSFYIYLYDYLVRKAKDFNCKIEPLDVHDLYDGSDDYGNAVRMMFFPGSNNINTPIRFYCTAISDESDIQWKEMTYLTAAKLYFEAYRQRPAYSYIKNLSGNTIRFYKYYIQYYDNQ